MNIFFDTSAFAKRFLDETGSQLMVELCHQANSVGLSILCLPEIISAVHRLKREKKLTIQQCQLIKKKLAREIEDVDICQLTDLVISKTIILLEHNALKTLDAIHIACALVWQANLFVSSDLQQIRAAEWAGIKTILV